MKGSDECPRCGSGDVIRMVIRGEPEHAACLACSTMWEPFDAGDVEEHLRGEEVPLFRAPCDNCAFLPGSPERSDPERWAGLQEQIHYMGHSFYCHKGVPIAEGWTHDHPLRPDGSHDTARMRLCAGFVAQKLGHASRELHKTMAFP